MTTILPQLRRTLFIAITAVAVACGSDEFSDRERFEMSRVRWSERAPASYTMTVTRTSCECMATGPTDVIVRNGVVVSRRYSATGADVPANLWGAFPSVGEMFLAIEAGLKAGTLPVSLQFDAALGSNIIASATLVLTRLSLKSAISEWNNLPAKL